MRMTGKRDPGQKARWRPTGTSGEAAGLRDHSVRGGCGHSSCHEGCWAVGLGRGASEEDRPCQGDRVAPQGVHEWPRELRNSVGHTSPVGTQQNQVLNTGMGQKDHRRAGQRKGRRKEEGSEEDFCFKLCICNKTELGFALLRNIVLCVYFTRECNILYM